jgi:mono/diheme cytochrome c family protein
MDAARWAAWDRGSPRILFLKLDVLFRETVLYGRGPMPAWSSVLSERDIADVHEWLLTR